MMSSSLIEFGWPGSVPAPCGVTVWNARCSKKDSETVLTVTGPEGETLAWTRCLGRGSAGSVSLYESAGVRAAIKAVPFRLRGNDVAGHSVLSSMPLNLRDAFVPTLRASIEGAECFVMPVAGGTLRGAPTGDSECFDAEILERTLHQVCSGLETLARGGYAYLDIKPENIVYVCSNGIYRLAFCDLGGLCVLGKGSAHATYPPPESPRGSAVAPTEASMLWGLGVLAVTLRMGHDPDLLFSETAGPERGDEFRRRVWMHVRKIGQMSPLGCFVAYCTQNAPGSTLRGARIILGGNQGTRKKTRRNSE